MAGSDEYAAARAMTPEEFRIWLKGQLDAITRELTTQADAIEALEARLSPLEQMRAIVLGAGAVLIAVIPMLWWILTKAAQLDKVGPKP